MTTIAYKDGIMACDSAWSDESLVLTWRTKIIRLASGGLLGEAGDCDSRSVVTLFDKVTTPARLPSRKELLDLAMEYSAILVLPKGKIFHVVMERDGAHWAGGLYEIGEQFFSVGAGYAHAFTAMECGKTARDAVVQACRRNLHSHLPVHVMRLTDKLRPIRKKR